MIGLLVPAILAVASIFLGFSALAQDDLKQSHSKLLAVTDHLAVTFHQDSYSAFRKRNTVRTGRAFFSIPRSFKWVFEDKDYGSEEYFFDGKVFSHYVERDNTVNHYHTGSKSNVELSKVVDLVLNPNKLLKDYRISESKKIEGGLSYHLKAKSGQNKTHEIAILLKKKVVHSVELRYLDGNRTKYRFSNHSTLPLKPEIFSFSKKGNGVRENNVR